MSLNLADLFEAAADAVPGRVAVVCGTDRLTYGELDAASNRLAHHLAGAGIGAGDRVGLYMRNSTEFVGSLLACLKIRAVPVNINYRYVDAELAYLFGNAELAAVKKLAIIRRGRGSSLQTADMNLAELLGQYGVSYATLKLLASEPLTGLHSRRYVQVSYESKLLERRQP